MIKFFVRTTLERELDISYNQIDFELLIDTEHKPVESFINQLEQISAYDAVLLEDDLLLCNNFKEEIEEVIRNHPNEIIQFYTKPSSDFTAHYSQAVVYNQCTYYPKGIGKILANEMRLYNGSTSGYDLIENKAIHKLGLYIYIHRPCLVQHIDNFSLIGKSRVYATDRITPYFKDYLDKYNIDYNNPSKVFANLGKLNHEKEEFINQIKADFKEYK
jgi:hypothetical protein